MLHHFHMSGPTQPVGSLPRGLWEGAGWRAWCTLDWDAWKAESRAVDSTLFCAYWCISAWCGTLYTKLSASIKKNANHESDCFHSRDEFWRRQLRHQRPLLARRIHCDISEQLCPVSPISHQCSKAQEISGDAM